MTSDCLTEWDQVKREFDRYEFTWPQFSMDLERRDGSELGERMLMNYGEFAAIRFSLWVRDTYHPARFAEIVTRRSVPFGLPVEAFDRWLLGAIRVLIDHEVRENFKQDGIVIHDPHKAR